MKRLSYYPPHFWGCCLSSFFFFSSFSMIIPELPNFLKGLGGEKYLGLIIFVFTITAGFSRPFSGKMTDKWGRKPVIILGIIATGVSALLYPLVTSILGFFLLRLFHGFSTGFQPTGAAAFVSDVAPTNRKGEAMGVFGTFTSIAMASSPALGSWISSNFGMNTLFITSFCFAFLSLLLILMIQETLKERTTFNFSMIKIKKDEIIEKNVLFTSLIMVLTAFSFGVVITLIPDFSDSLSIKNRGIFFTFFTCASLLVRILGGRISDVYGRIFVLKIGCFLLTISMLIIGFSSDIYQFFLGAVFFGLGFGFSIPTLFAWAIDLSKEKSTGKGLATLFIAQETGIGIGSLFGGYFYKVLNFKFPFIFNIAFCLCFVALFLLMIVRKMRKDFL